MTTSFIIPTMWRSNFTGPLFDALRIALDAGIIHEVIVVDNDPTARPDGVHLDNFRVLPQAENIGVNPAWNLGAREASGDLIALCNDDLCFDVSRWWPAMTSALSESTGTVIGLHPMGFNRTATQLGDDAGRFVMGHFLGVGWGCLLTMHRSSYVPVPDGLRVWWGDNWFAAKLTPASFALPCTFEASATVRDESIQMLLANEAKTADSLGLQHLPSTPIGKSAIQPLRNTGCRHRWLQPTDEKALRKGFEEAFFVRRPEIEWQWRYGQRPNAHLQQVAVNDAGELAGHIGWNIEKAVIQGAPVRCMQAGDMFRRDATRGASVHLIPGMLRLMFEEVDADPTLAWTFGFQTPRLRARNDRLLRFDANVPLPLLSIDARPARFWRRQTRKVFSFPQSTTESSGLDDLWQRAAHRYFVSVVRDGAWFAHRYDAHPTKSYTHLGVKNRRGEWSTWLTVGERLGTSMVVDLVWDGASERDLRVAFEAARELAASRGHEQLTAWLLGDAQAMTTMAAMGWQRGEDPQEIGLTIRHSHPALHKSDYPLRHYVTAGYSDLV